jgi:hypothetical protein
MKPFEGKLVLVPMDQAPGGNYSKAAILPQLPRGYNTLSNPDDFNS